MKEPTGSVSVSMSLFESPRIKWAYHHGCDCVLLEMGRWPNETRIALYHGAAQRLYEVLGQALTERENVTATNVHLSEVPQGDASGR